MLNSAYSGYNLSVLVKSAIVEKFLWSVATRTGVDVNHANCGLHSVDQRLWNASPVLIGTLNFILTVEVKRVEVIFFFVTEYCGLCFHRIRILFSSLKALQKLTVGQSNFKKICDKDSLRLKKPLPYISLLRRLGTHLWPEWWIFYQQQSLAGKAADGSPIQRLLEKQVDGGLS